MTMVVNGEFCKSLESKTIAEILPRGPGRLPGDGRRDAAPPCASEVRFSKRICVSF